MFSPLSADPTGLRVMSWQSIEDTFDVIGPIGKRNYQTQDYAVKVIPSDSPSLANELKVSNALNSLLNQTKAFVFTNGYILSPDLPPDYVELDLEKPENLGHFVHLFMENIDFNFGDLADEPKVNEDFYFEILIGLYYARKRFNFTHWDIHEGQLMFNELFEKTTRRYRIGDFYVTIANSDIEPKLIDYGKSMIAPEYDDSQAQNPQYKKMWNKSDIYHLSRIFSQRQNLSPKFRDFLDRVVLPAYRSSMYATRPEKDSANNYQNIEDLLRIYFVDTD